MVFQEPEEAKELVRRRSRERRKSRSDRLRKNKRLNNFLYGLRWVVPALLIGAPIMVGLFYLLHNL